MFIFTRSITRSILLATVALTTIGLTRSSLAQPSHSRTLLPFFDSDRNPIPVDFPVGARKDITPPPPIVERFDERVLELCGTGFNAPVSQSAFRQLLLDYPDVLQKLQAATDGELRRDRRSPEKFLDDLVAVWFNEQGFKHIFCGEISGNSGDNIGGLHLAARYWQLQQEGTGGRITGRVAGRDTVEEVVDGVIYTFAVAIKKDDRIIAQHRVKGYSYVLNAQELLIHTTKAFKSSYPRLGDEKFACLYTVNTPETAPFTAVFVQNDGAIVTFYPDATPSRDRTQGTCASDA